LMSLAQAPTPPSPRRTSPRKKIFPLINVDTSQPAQVNAVQTPSASQPFHIPSNSASPLLTEAVFKCYCKTILFFYK
jgi:hypothetical protein